MITKLDTPIFYSNDVKSTVAFYVKLLGFSIDSDFGDYVELRIGDSKLAINAADGNTKVAGYQTAIFCSSDIEADFKLAQKNEIQIDRKLSDSGYGQTFIMRDPDGNKIEVIE